ncbi:aldo/keto reductase [Azospirillum rugosum]|uniref:Aryl-alcohol dehydrogenase-like predicted oxidoreductase n=1 Tax=Azospirillum rugosum TaxID=416170 RepID=A0ABS4SVD8_9PROT|nr:aldo/keto reductase [Azospirillum rugosum]MBP2296519.1 aryl-alcohol dehydrogenase-like predicted oxidoreductase [Azospirillum rugosum]MDQ0530081.1 aryl-alcohol dehydrogenase-like predicted oxidoreductase [Azospirillum rugosum]
MEQRQLGRSGLTVAPLCFGGNVFGWTADEATSFRLLDAFLDAGFNFIDTADVYSAWAPGNTGGESETIIGNWLKSRGNRDRVVIATKVGSEMGPGRKGLSAAYIRSAVEDSLRRLQTDRIDLYQSHWDDPDTPFEETLGAYQRLIQEGKVRAIGASNLTAARLREALEVAAKAGLPRYETLQPEYNLYDRSGYEAELEGVCRENGLGVISYYSLAAGFLTGKYRSAEDAGKSARGGGVVSKYLNDRGRAILAALDEVAAQHRATPAQVALAWLIARPGLTAPIASASKVEQMGDLVAAARLRLDAASIERLNAASA